MSAPATTTTVEQWKYLYVTDRICIEEFEYRVGEALLGSDEGLKEHALELQLKRLTEPRPLGGIYFFDDIGSPS